MTMIMTILNYWKCDIIHMICHKYYFVAQQEEREKDKLYKDAAEMSILPVSISYSTSSVFRIVCIANYMRYIFFVILNH